MKRIHVFYQFASIMVDCHNDNSRHHSFAQEQIIYLISYLIMKTKTKPLLILTHALSFLLTQLLFRVDDIYGGGVEVPASRCVFIADICFSKDKLGENECFIGDTIETVADEQIIKNA